jgi:hypothetical protein
LLPEQQHPRRHIQHQPHQQHQQYQQHPNQTNSSFTNFIITATQKIILLLPTNLNSGFYKFWCTERTKNHISSARTSHTNSVTHK